MINDNQSLVSVKTQFGNEIEIYDDGSGPLWILRDSMGIVGIVRADTWENAYSICEDEFFPEADETIEELKEEYGFIREHIKIIRTKEGVEREAQASDYPFEKSGCSFVKWETRETPCIDENGFMDNELFQEAFGFRPNGPNINDKLKHGIYQKDLNGESLDLLTKELASDLNITIETKEITIPENE